MTHVSRRLTQGCAGLVLSLLLWVSAAIGQQADPPDYTAWESFANTAEAMIELEQVSDERFESLRSELAGWRQVFQDAQDDNASQIQTLEAQIEALGPVPEDGSETPEVSEQRAALTQQLAEERAPVVRAQTAYSRADSMISEIDTIIRERQADALLAFGPSPINPVHWPLALADLQSMLTDLWADIRAEVANPYKRSQALANLPLTLLYLLVGFMLVSHGQTWARAGVELLRGATRRGSGVFRFLVSLGQILLPYIGILAILESLDATGFSVTDLDLILAKLPFWVAMLFGIRWLADQAFNDDDEVVALPLAPEERPKARRYANFLAILFVLGWLLDTLIEIDGFSDATAAVTKFPVLVLLGFVLVRLGRVRNHEHMIGSREAAEAGPGDIRLRFSRLLGRLCQIVGIIGPVLAAIGYFMLGEKLIYPTIATLALVGLVLVLQRFVYNLYELATGRNAEAAQSLMPVLAGFVLSMGAMPLLALIWGARVADLTEIWTRTQQGITLGDTRLTPTTFFVVIAVFAVGYTLTRLLQAALRGSVLPKTKIDQGGQNAIVSGVGYFGIFTAVLVSVTAGGLDLSSLAIVAGALSVGIGFGLQNIVSNFVSGIILLIERPISEGDWIEVGGMHGTVKDISVRSTRIETFDRYDLIIPNSDLVSGTVSNYTRGNVLGRVIVEVGVAYGTDTRKVERILLNIAREHEMVLMNPEPAVDFMGFGADSLDFRIRAVVRDINYGVPVRTEMRHQIVERFAEEGIEIPFAQRDVWLRNPEALASAIAAAQPERGEETETGVNTAKRRPNARPLSVKGQIEGEE